MELNPFSLKVNSYILSLVSVTINSLIYAWQTSLKPVLDQFFYLEIGSIFIYYFLWIVTSLTLI
jgi:hypothetical protein